MAEQPRGGELYSIGAAAKKVNLTCKTLRFYDSIGILTPDKIGENDYRYYSKETLLRVPVIKYYKQMGFQIDELRDLITGTTFCTIARIFDRKIAERQKEQSHIHDQYVAITDWHSMVLEAMEVIEFGATEVGVRFFERTECLTMRQPYKPDYRDTIINIEFTNYIESLDNEISGPVIRCFDSVEERLHGMPASQTILQKPVKPCADGQCSSFGGGIMLSCYHIGSHDTLLQAYERMEAWAHEHHYRCGPKVYERFVADYWLTDDEEQFVTEIIMEVSR